jgi:hypothetical protein
MRAARVLLAMGHTGKLTLLDGKTGKPRTIIDIEKAARLCMREGPLRFENVNLLDRAASPEEALPGMEAA